MDFRAPSLTHAHNIPRVLQTSGPGATPTLNTDNYAVAEFIALAAAITSMSTNLTGTPTIYQPLLIVFKDNATARAITWGASFASYIGTLPVTTVLSQRLTVAFLYGVAGSSTWDCVSSLSAA